MYRAVPTSCVQTNYQIIIVEYIAQTANIRLTIYNKCQKKRDVIGIRFAIKITHILMEEILALGCSLHNETERMQLIPVPGNLQNAMPCNRVCT